MFDPSNIGGFPNGVKTIKTPLTMKKMPHSIKKNGILSKSFL
jgi:hypothetical protein